jgi:dTDP-4-dehydrorhamnose reductase
MTAPQSPSHPLPLSNPILLGAGGMLHRAWANLLDGFGLKHRDFTRAHLDLANPQSIDSALGDCRLVINCAAYTNVDQAEKEETIATAVNGTGVGQLAQACKKRSALLVHYSTDYVFPGHGTRPYLPNDPIQPLGAYGRSKAVGEKLIRESGCDHLIIRTSWLYAPWSKNFVRTIVGFIKKGQTLKIVNDQIGRPTSSEHLAQTSLALIEKNARGTFHATDAGQCTWFDFAEEIGRHINPDHPISPCTSADLARPAARPAYSVLDLSQTESLIGPMLPWQQTLADVLPRLDPPI